jgi:hypothetical protein
MLMRVAVLSVGFAVAWTPGAIAEPQFETAPVLKAAEILPPELLKGEHHRVAEDVRTDGYLNYYAIDSDFGELVAEGTPLLRMRVREIEALAELEEIAKSDVFLEAAKEAGVDLGRGLWRGVSHPVRSVKTAPKGASRLFKKIARGAKSGVEKAGELVGVGDDDASGEDPETIRESYYSVSDGEREWAARLGVNPYSSNEVLRKAIRAVSRVAFAGEISVSVASSLAVPIPGLGAAAGIINEAANDVWNTDPYKLRRENILKLQKAGVAETTIEAFIDNPWYSPAMQTLLLHGLLRMDRVPGTMTVLDVAVEAESEAEARYFLNGALLMVWFHENEAPVERVLAASGLPEVVTTDGRQIAFASLDYLFWGESFAGAAQVAVSRPVLGKRELWVLGAVSDRARAELAALGVTVRDHTGEHARAKRPSSATDQRRQKLP